MAAVRLNRDARSAVLWNFLALILWCLGACPRLLQASEDVRLRFNGDGTFKILQARRPLSLPGGLSLSLYIFVFHRFVRRRSI